MSAAVTVLIFGGVFALIFQGEYDRRLIVLAGALLVLAFGLIAGFYTPAMAVDAIYFETLALIFGMSAITAMLARSGLFALIAARAARYSLGNGWWLLVAFALVTYSLSVIVNNLSAMVVILPVTLAICRDIGANPVPVVVAEIVASNLGGASTMIGDFPNMIIAAAAGLKFLDFIGGMMVPCLVLLAVMLLYFQRRRAEIGGKPPARTARGEAVAVDPFEEFLHPPVDAYLMQLGLAILSAALLGFLFAEQTGIPPAWVAFWTGALALLLGQFNADDLAAACGTSDLIFFAGLFVLVGALDAAHVLDGLSWVIDTLSFGYDLPRLLVLMWIAAFAAAFLNAGAATAFLIPIADEMYRSTFDISVWWALSLGILAGSSATVIGATAGSLATSQLERFVVAHPELRVYTAPGKGLDFQGYLRWGLPLAGVFLGVSTVYIALIAK